MFEDDRAYFRHRADVEFERARSAKGPEAAVAHRRLAQAYLKKVAASDPVMDEAA